MMGSKTHRLFEELTKDEQASFVKLCSCGCDSPVPVAHAAKLLDLGLVEVSCGGVMPTRTGRQVFNLRQH